MYDSIKALKLEQSDGILTITMDNPPLNANTQESHRELSQIFDMINHDDETAVVVLTGAGERGFSAGGDIDEMLVRYEERDHPRWNRQMDEARHIIYGMMRLEKPLIGRVNGHAIGLGSSLAALCDISYMMAKAKIADTHVPVGLTAGDGGALLWPLLIGFQKARYHLFTGEPMTGSEAADAGLITGAVETIEELDEKVYGLAKKLVNSPRVALNTTKQAINLVLRNIAEGMVETHLGLETQSAWTNDHYEAGQAFRDKRAPKFTGD